MTEWLSGIMPRKRTHMLINKALCRSAILEQAKATRHHPFTRVGADVYDHLHMLVKREIEKLVRAQPSMGRTVCMGTKKQPETETEGCL